MMASHHIKADITLQDLLAGIAPCDAPAASTVVTGLCMDSRTAKLGDCFLACPGSTDNGIHYIGAAIRAGVKAVLYESMHADHLDIQPANVPIVPVSNLRVRAGDIAARFFGHPADELTIIGVTGTNGKTSVTHFIADALGRIPGAGPCGLIGTLGNGLFPKLQPQETTTPDALALHGLLADMRSQGARRIALEVSSHALAQHRVAGVTFDTALFTNLSRDHLDYHGSMVRYAESKKRLFSMPGLKHAIVCFDDPFGAELLEAIGSGVDILGYSLDDARLAPPFDNHPVIRAQLTTSPRGTRIRINAPSGETEMDTRLPGRFNAANLVAALAVLIQMEIPLTSAALALSSIQGVPGRMEMFGGTRGKPRVVVDYAHTPDGLQRVLKALREICTGTLWCVFGCGGDRDPGKRPMMGKIAASLADHVIVTDDNPRHEDANTIIEQIVNGIEDKQKTQVTHDRRQAIIQSLSNAQPEDIVLIAGKGHEQYQDLGTHRISFSDRAVVQSWLEEQAP